MPTKRKTKKVVRRRRRFWKLGNADIGMVAVLGVFIFGVLLVWGGGSGWTRKSQIALIPTPTVAPTASPTPRPFTDPTIDPSNPGNGSQCPQSMPVGDLPGWRQVFTEDFTQDAQIGKFPGTAYDSKWRVYLDGWPDTGGKQGKPSRYYPSKVISVTDGILTKYLHTQDGIPMGAALLPKISDTHLYGKYTVCFRSAALPGFKTAWLLWPDVGDNQPYGEIDFPEGDLGSTIHAYMHHINATTNGDQDAFSTGIPYTSWHVASTEWSQDLVRFVLDGQEVGRTTTRVPNTPMHWVLQTESCFPTCPDPRTAGDLQIDWVVFYVPQ